MDKDQLEAFRKKVKREASPKRDKGALPGIGGTEPIDEEPLEITDDDWMRDGRDTSEGSQKKDDSE